MRLNFFRFMRIHNGIAIYCHHTALFCYCNYLFLGKTVFFLYIGASANPKQLRRAVTCYHKINNVIGVKMFAGESVGDLAIIAEDKQQMVYQTLADLNYKGVLAVHCEKQSLLQPDLFDPDRPFTHSQARPKIAEIESLQDQIRFAQKAGFKGVLHVVHVSCPESVKLIESARKSLKITCAATPHHLLWSEEMMSRPDGLLYKMNPPLRSSVDVKALRQMLKQGKIDWIETDHAPHQVGEKLFSDYMSGFPSLLLYKELVEKQLPAWGLSKQQIKALTYWNIVKVFEKVC